MTDEEIINELTARIVELENKQEQIEITIAEISIELSGQDEIRQRAKEYED